TGLIYIGTARYYFNSDGTMVSEAWETVGSSTYYFNSSGRAVTGLVYIGSSRYYFNSDGSMVTKTWVSVDGTKYYLTSSGKAAVGLCYIGAGRYYFNDDGSMLTNSWKSVDNEVFYFTRSGIAATGMCYVGSEKYFFDDAGVLRKGENSIAGETTTTVNKMVEYFTQNNTYPSYYENTDAPTISDFCKIYYEEAAVEGIRAEVAFSQAMLETNWLRFTGDVSIEQFNFAGIGTTGNGVVGASFENVREGIRAQIQHL
ncbi:glucosaminidase domain-containing protein, partial [Mediterraneibacter glycyrrhizinilyticus]